MRNQGKEAGRVCASLCTRVVCVCAASCAASCVYSASAGTSGTTSDRTSDGPRTSRHSLSPLPPPYSDLSSPPSLSLPFPTLSSPSIPSPTRSSPSFPPLLLSPLLLSSLLLTPLLPTLCAHAQIQEMVDLYHSKGLGKDDARSVVEIMSKNEPFFVNLMMLEELEMQVRKKAGSVYNPSLHV